MRLLPLVSILACILAQSAAQYCRCEDGELELVKTCPDVYTKIGQKLCLVGTASESKQELLETLTRMLKDIAMRQDVPFEHHFVTVDHLTHFPVTELRSCTQVWLVDFQRWESAESDDAKSMLAIMERVGDWFNGITGEKHIIADGRIASSIIVNDKDLFGNYFENLQERGYGLVLASDHDEYAYEGVNRVADMIKVDRFRGEWVGTDLDVDTNAALISRPRRIDSNARIEAFTASPRVPSGEQANGMMMYPVGFYDQYQRKAAITASFYKPREVCSPKSTTYEISIVGNTCGKHYRMGDLVSLLAIVEPRNPDFQYTWKLERSDILSFSTVMENDRLGPGKHAIALEVTSPDGSAVGVAHTCFFIDDPFAPSGATDAVPEIADDGCLPISIKQGCSQIPQQTRTGSNCMVLTFDGSSNRCDYSAKQP